MFLNLYLQKNTLRMNSSKKRFFFSTLAKTHSVSVVRCSCREFKTLPCELIRWKSWQGFVYLGEWWRSCTLDSLPFITESSCLSKIYLTQTEAKHRPTTKEKKRKKNKQPRIVLASVFNTGLSGSRPTTTTSRADLILHEVTSINLGRRWQPPSDCRWRRWASTSLLMQKNKLQLDELTGNKQVVCLQQWVSLTHKHHTTRWCTPA